jgi:hypothetical protein
MSYGGMSDALLADGSSEFGIPARDENGSVILRQRDSDGMG